jgi:hypothetical protein
MRQYNPMKPHKWGFKIFTIGWRGYVVRFEVYEGKSERPTIHGATFDLVMRLVDQLRRLP